MKINTVTSATMKGLLAGTSTQHHKATGGPSIPDSNARTMSKIGQMEESNNTAMLNDYD